MTGTKITALTSYTDPAPTDVLPIVDVANTATKKIEVGVLLKNASSGTAAAPGLAFDTDPDTGFYRVADNTLGLSTGGVHRALVDGSGRVLVGGTDARANLYNTSTTAALQVEGTTTSTSIGALFRNSNDTGGGALVLGKTRGTAVGATTVVQSGDSLGSISFQGSDGTQFVEAASISVVVDTTPGADDMPGRLVFSTTADGASTPTERLRLDANGQIILGSLGTAAAPTLTLTGDLNTGIYSPGADQLSIATGGSQRLTVVANGNVGIGTASPSCRLDVTSTDAIKLAAGTTAQRPGSPSAGMIRYNSTLNQFEGYGTAWGALVSVNSGSIAGTRNRIINGSMMIDQRNAGAAQTITAGAALAYTVDRWYAYCTGANVAGQRVTGAVTGTFRYRFTGAASVTAIAFAQRIEQLNSADLAGTTATLSADLANSLLTTVTWTAYYADTADTFGTLASPTRTQIATGTWTVNSTVTRYSAQIAVPAAATTGIEIVLSVGAQTSGTWTIGDVQLEAGTVATPFERRSYGLELMLCQRYAAVGLLAYQLGYIASGGSLGVSVTLPAPMRATPTLTQTATSNSNVGTTVLGSSGFQSVFVYAPGINIGAATLSSTFNAIAEL